MALLLMAQSLMAQTTIQITYDETNKTLTLDCPKGCGFDPKNKANKTFSTLFLDELTMSYDGHLYEALDLADAYKKLAGWFYFRSCKFDINRTSFSSADSADLANTDLRIANFDTDGFPTSVGKPNEIQVDVTILHKAPADTNSLPAPDKTMEKEEEEKEGGNGLILIIIATVALAGIGAFLFFKKKRQKVAAAATSAEQQELGLVVVEEDSQNYEVGLKYVQSDLAHYYQIDLGLDYANTAVKKIFFHYSVVKKMYDYFKHFLETPEQTNETGCYFVGCWEYANSAHTEYNISLEEIVEPGDDIQPGEFSFNFGKIIGLKLSTTIDNLCQKTNRAYVQTVWMHSHPGLGLFLSSHDLLVQQQLTYTDDKNRLVAIVIDTNTPDWQMAIFSAKSSGEMNNKDTLTRTYSLDELYQWSRSAAKTPAPLEPPQQTIQHSPSIQVENYHVVQINHQGNGGIQNLYFNGTAISALDDLLYNCNDTTNICGYFIGHEEETSSYVIENCTPTIQPNTIGILMANNSRSYSEIIAHSGAEIPPNGFAIIYRSDEELWICNRQGGELHFTNEKEITHCSLKPMKEWMRRRRIYK